MPSAQPDRLDRIEAILEELAHSQQATSRDVSQLVTLQQRSSHELSAAMFRLANTQEGKVDSLLQYQGGES
jgi:hypothetical protein